MATMYNCMFLSAVLALIVSGMLALFWLYETFELLEASFLEDEKSFDRFCDAHLDRVINTIETIITQSDNGHAPRIRIAIATRDLDTHHKHIADLNATVKFYLKIIEASQATALDPDYEIQEQARHTDNTSNTRPKYKRTHDTMERNSNTKETEHPEFGNAKRRSLASNRVAAEDRSREIRARHNWRQPRNEAEHRISGDGKRDSSAEYGGSSPGI